MGLFKRRKKGKKRARGLKKLGRAWKKTGRRLRGVSRVVKRGVRSKAVSTIATGAATAFGGPGAGKGVHETFKYARQGLDAYDKFDRGRKRAKKRLVSRAGLESVRAAGGAMRQAQQAQQMVNRYGAHRVPQAAMKLQQMRQAAQNLHRSPQGRILQSAMRGLRWR